jgi:hypothetical protein
MRSNIMRFMVCVEITTNPDGQSRMNLLTKLRGAFSQSTISKVFSKALGCDVCLKTAEDAVDGFFEAIESTGGVTKQKQGWHVPVADEGWIDLGEAYVAACSAFDRVPMIAAAEEADDGE